MKEQIISKTITRNILLNPGPATTSTRVKSAMVVSDICPREEEFGDLFLNLSGRLLDVVNARNSHEAILIGSSGTGAVEAVLSSCNSGNKSILIIDNGAYGDRMAKICEVYGVAYETLKFPWGDIVDISRVEEFLVRNAHNFESMAFVHHETTSGILNPMNEMCELAKKYNLVTIVDAMSSYAGIEIDLNKTQVDYLISSSNKCIQAMAGIGIVIAKKEELQRISKFKAKTHYFDLYKNFENQKQKKQFLFTPPVQTVYALKEAVEEYFSEGQNGRINRYASLYELMVKGMTELGFRLLAPIEQHSKILTAFIEPNHLNYSFDSMHSYLYERGITIYPGKGAKQDSFRISNIGDLNKDDMTYFLTQISQYLKDSKIDPLYR
ncbi:2-aminoethylphosphonate--pyruvate transaminase [Bacteriovorax sp. BSW11_IV]|uniref:2-aminoethylphosphonate aminotransferase n=1 Tax=Bacteriovorax sp. BSW11_IV TaxID=1353529 RepID=UPI00038A181F|nr:2-aminoethylphosphonate--pyruvate transaminase [Bacteriovorax sp. BSW11_IV]EQC47781.1 2-aminoethylphosphonate--pyruvate transaminase [Bacteriovorax sp. BSW11_IV]